MTPSYENKCIKQKAQTSWRELGALLGRWRLEGGMLSARDSCLPSALLLLLSQCG